MPKYRWAPQPKLRATLDADSHSGRWLCDQTGLSVVTVSGIITGRCRLTPRTRDLIAIAMRRPADELFDLDALDDAADPVPDPAAEPWELLPPLDDETIDRIRRLLFPQRARRVVESITSNRVTAVHND